MDEYKTIITSLRRLEGGASNMVEEMKEGKYPSRVERILNGGGSGISSSSNIGVDISAGGDFGMVEDGGSSSHFEVSQSTEDILKRLEGISSPVRIRAPPGGGRGIIAVTTPAKTASASASAATGEAKTASSISLHEQEHLANQLIKDIKNYNDSRKTLIPELPAHLQAFKDQFEKYEKEVKDNPDSMKLPIIRQLTPRTKKKVSLLPKPSASEEVAIKKIEDTAAAIDTGLIYNHVQGVAKDSLKASQQNHLAEPIELLISKRNEMGEKASDVSKGKLSQDEVVLAITNETIFDKSKKHQQRVTDRSNKMAAMFSPSDKMSSQEQKVYSPNTSTNANSNSSTKRRPVLIPDKEILSPIEVSYDSQLRLYLNEIRSNSSTDIAALIAEASTNLSPRRDNIASSSSFNKPSPLAPPSNAPSPYKVASIYPGDLSKKALFKSPRAAAPGPTAQSLSLSPMAPRKLISSSLPSTPQVGTFAERDTLGLFTQYSFGNSIDKNSNNVSAVAVGNSDSAKTNSLQLSTSNDCDDDEEADSTTIIKNKIAINSANSSNNNSSHVLNNDSPKFNSPISVKAKLTPKSIAPIISDYLPVIEETEEKSKEVAINYSIKQADAQKSIVRDKELNKEHKRFINHMKISLFDEFGVDVDKQFTKNRTLTNAVKFLLFYVYSQVVPETFAHWRRQTTKLQRARTLRAGSLLSRVALGMLGRKAARIARANKQKQALAEDRLRKKLEIRKRWCRFMMEFHLKRWLVTKVLIRRRLREMMVTRMQKIARGIIGRRLARDTLRVFKLKTSKAITIQCAYRMHLAYRTVLLKKKLRFVTHYLSELERRQLAMKEFMKRSGAASKIMKVIKCYKLKKGLKRFSRRLRLKRIVRIQCMIRRFVARVKFIRDLARFRARAGRMEGASRRIQCMIRCFLAKIRVRSKRYFKYLDRQQYINRKAKLLRQEPTFMWKLKRKFKYDANTKLMHASAVKIQALFRGLRCRRRRIREKINSYLLAKHKKEIHRGEMANLIQRVWRGRMSRRASILRKKNKAAIVIQCFLRYTLSKKVVSVKRNIKIKMTIVLRALRRYIGYRRYWKMKVYKNKYGIWGIKINRATHRYLGRQKLKVLKYKRRLDKEIEIASAFKINRLLIMMQLRLIMECISRPISKSPMLFSNNRCFCNGVLQALFVNAAAAGGTSDIASLATNRATASSILSFLKRIEGVFDGGQPEFSGIYPGFPKIGFYQPPSRPNTHGGSRPGTNSDGTKESKKARANANLRKKKKQQLPYSLLLDYIRTGNMSIPEIQQKITSIDVDIAFEKCKSEGEQGLDYTEFVNFIKILSDLLYKPREIVGDNISLVEGGGGSEKEGTSKLSAVAKKVPGENLQKLYSKLYYPGHNLKTNFHLCLFLKALISLWKDPWVGEILDYLERESRNMLGFYSIKIQCMIRKKIAYKVWHVKVREKKERDSEMDVARKVTKFQTLLRMKLARKKLARQAQRFLVKYIPFEGNQKSYWYNPSTRLAQYTKPLILGSFECVTIPMPPVGLEYVVKCSNCTVVPAVKNCSQCEDSFCSACFTALHSKGSRLKHTSYPITMCGYCKFQMATKSCSSCFLNRPKVGSLQEMLLQSERGSYCDSCFIYSHHKYEHSLEMRDVSIKEAARTLLYNTKDSYLVAHQIRQQLITKHKYDYLVQACEECEWRSSAWRCNDCAQIYCNTCLLGLHSIGGPFCGHVAEKIPYFTPAMNKSYNSDALKQVFHVKMGKFNRVKAQLLNDSRGKMAVRIQTWWRMVSHGYRGRQLIRRQRMAQSRAGKLYKRETEMIRNTPEYKRAQYHGNAPALASDNRRDKVLRTISSKHHEFADHFILKNLSDWGWYRTSPKEPRKGVPKQGYDVGSMVELVDQATFGGYRMPGRVFPVLGNSCFSTSTDLSKFLNPGEIVRIKGQLFKVIKTGSPTMTVTMDRKWRDYKNQNPEGEVLYRMPCYASDPYKLGVSLQYKAFDAFILKNPLVQTYYSTKTFVFTHLSNMAATMMGKCTSENDISTALKWRTKSIQYLRKSLVSSTYTSKNFEVVQLGTSSNPEQEKLKKDNEERAARAAEAVRVRNEKTLQSGKDVEEKILLKALDFKNLTAEEVDKLTPKSKAEYDKAMEELDKLNTATAAAESELEPVPEPEQPPDQTSDIEADREDEIARLGKVADSLSSSVSIGDKIVQSEAAMSLYAQVQINHPRKPPRFERPAGTRWYAIKEENEDRIRREEKMTKEELASEAHDYEECYDPLSEIVFYVHIPTNEMLSEIPRQLKMHRQIKEDNERNLRNYREANERIKKIEALSTKRVMLGGGGRKKFGV